MYAKNLERLLAELMESSDFSHVGPEFQARFESLRGHGRLPAGRDKRGQALTSQQIAAAVLGLVTPMPKWAGHAATVLRGFRPVGRPESAFGKTATLVEAIALLLDDKNQRTKLIRVSLSGAEGGMNSNGFASVMFEEDGRCLRTDYVPSTAYTDIQPGADGESDHEKRFAPVSRELSLNRTFFERLAREMELARLYPKPPEGDGSEYDEEEARQARNKALGVTSRSRFLNIGVENQVTWPKEETLARFDRYQLVLMPKTADHVQSIHIDLAENRLDNRSARTVINRFLSVMSWCDDNFAIAGDGWSGNPVPVAVPKPNLAFTTAFPWVFDRKIPREQEAQRAVALYREAVNAEFGGLVSYAVLNFYKIVELRHHGKETVRKWFRDNLAVLERDETAKDDLKRFYEICGQEQPHLYIHNSCRIAVSHANKHSKSDPDDAHEIVRLHIAANVMRRLARRFIEVEFKVSDSAFSGD